MCRTPSAVGCEHKRTVKVKQAHDVIERRLVWNVGELAARNRVADFDSHVRELVM